MQSQTYKYLVKTDFYFASKINVIIYYVYLIIVHEQGNLNYCFFFPYKNVQPIKNRVHQYILNIHILCTNTKL